MLPGGRRIAIDYGAVRVGIAMSDPSSILATPFQTFRNEEALDQVCEIINEYEISVVYVGLPLHLSGEESNSSGKVRDFSSKLRELISDQVSIRLLDERLSTKTATEKAMTGQGRVDREEIDQLAAAEILENALQIEKALNRLAGHEVST